MTSFRINNTNYDYLRKEIHEITKKVEENINETHILQNNMGIINNLNDNISILCTLKY